MDMKGKRKRKKNKLLSLVAGIVALGVLGGAYALILAYNERKAAEAAAEEAAKSAKIVLAEYKITDVRYVEYSYEGETVKLEYKNDYWCNAEDNNFPLDQTRPTSMATALAAVAADRLVEEQAADLAKYGLDDPYAYIYVKYADGTDMKMLLGDLNAFTGTRYMNIDGTRKVYLVPNSLLSNFRYNHNDLILHDTIPSVEFASVTEITVTTRSDDGAENVRRYYKEALSSSDGEETSEQDEMWMLDDGLGEPNQVERGTVKELFDSVTGLSLRNCEAYNVRDDQTLRKYGLGSAAAKTVAIKYSVKAEVTGDGPAISSTAARTVDKELSVSYSAPDADGKTYVNIEGSKLIYSLHTEEE